MDPKDLKKYLAGLGIAGLLAGGTAIAADAPKAGDDKTKSTPNSTTTQTAPEKKAPPKSG
jgi:radical SAM modification target selenobiotic family peptide